MSYTYFAEVTRVIFVHQDSVVMLTTGITTTTRMASVFSNTTMACGDVAALLAILVETGRLLYTTKDNR